MKWLAIMMVLAQTAAVRRGTPNSDDPGIVVRQAGALSISGSDGGSVATDSQAAAIANEIVNGSATVRVLNLPPPPARNPLTGAAKTDLPPNACQENGGKLSALLDSQTNGSQVTGISDAGVLNVNPIQGASTDSTLWLLLDGGIAKLDIIASELVNGTAMVKVMNMPPLPARNAVTGAAKVDGSGAVQPVSATSLPLPAGAATDAALVSLLATLLTTTPVNVVAVPIPINPFLLRCNPVRRTNCQP